MSKIAKKDFIAFASTYFAIILLVLLSLLPICWAFERSEQKRALQEIRDYAVSSMRELELRERTIFNTTRNLYSDSDFRSLYYRSTRGEGNSLFYDMTQLQKRIRLYYQNIKSVEDVLVYLPKFDYVMTENYIFDGREKFYSHVESVHFQENEDWLAEFPVDSTGLFHYSDEVTNDLVSDDARSTMNLSYYFPMYGDANIRMLVIVSMNPDEVAKSFLMTPAMEYGFSVLTDLSGRRLAGYGPDGGPVPETLPAGDQLSVRLEDGSYQMISVEAGEYRLILGVRDEYFAPIHRAAQRLVLADVGVALILGTAAAFYFTRLRSRPIERILHIIKDMEKSTESKNAFGEIEDTVLNLISEIGQCKTTIGELDSMVANSLLEKLFFGGLETERNMISFSQYFGDLSYPYTVLVFANPEVGRPEEMRPALERQLSALSEKPHILHIRGSRLYYLMETVPELSNLLGEKLRHLRETENLVVKVGVSNSYEGIALAKSAATQAERRLQAGYHIPGVFVFTHTHSSRAVRSLISVSELDSLQRALLGGSRQTADRLLENVYERVNGQQPDSVELRQMFFSLRSVYSAVFNQFALEAERSGEKQYHAPRLPDDLDEYYLESVQSAFMQMNQELYEQYEIVMTRTARNLGAEVLAWVEAHYSDPGICAGSIAEHFNISEKYVFSLIKGAGNETLNDRISELRVQEGIRLLKNTDLTVAAIAQKIGFTSSNTMYKVFRRVKGVSPSAYRSKQIQG